MIFVTVGTTEFNGLVEAADKLKLEEEVIIQKGRSACTPTKCQHFDYTHDFDDYVKKADVVVTHGGAGTIYKLVKQGKKIVGVENNERDDRHQFDLLGKMEAEGHLVWCRDLVDLKKCIQKAQKTEFKKYKQPKCEIVEMIIKEFG